MYLWELHIMKGYKALRHRFPFCSNCKLLQFFSRTLTHTHSLLSLCRLSSLSFSFSCSKIKFLQSLRLWKKRNGARRGGYIKYQQKIKNGSFGGLLIWYDMISALSTLKTHTHIHSQTEAKGSGRCSSPFSLHLPF